MALGFRHFFDVMLLHEDFPVLFFSVPHLISASKSGTVLKLL